MSVGVFEAAGLADIFELSSAEVVIEDVRCALEATRATHDGNAFPDAARGLAWSWRVGEVEVYIVGDGEIEFAVAIIVNEGAARSPLFAGTGNACLLRYLLEGSVALVVEGAIFGIGGGVCGVEHV